MAAPKVARALCCYPVAFAGSSPEFTARTLRRLLRDARTLNCPIGLFPEGAAATAGRLSAPLPGVDRLLRQLAKSNWPIVPAGIGEAGVGESRRLRVHIGPAVSASAILDNADPAALAMDHIRQALTLVI